MCKLQGKHPFSCRYVGSQSNLTAYKMKEMDILALPDDGRKNVIILQMLYVCKQRKKRNREIIPLICSFCFAVMFLQIKLSYNDLFSVLHYL